MQAQAAIFRQQLADATLRSPIDGVVAEKRTDVGQRLGDARIGQLAQILGRHRLDNGGVAALDGQRVFQAAAQALDDDRVAGARFGADPGRRCLGSGHAA